jgi:LL-diaminopimelate aminotransferase
MWHAERLSKLPPYLFVEIDRKKRAAIEAGRDVIDFGVGDPDQPTHKFIVDRMAEAIRTPSNHRYALGVGSIAFRKAVAGFFAKRFGVELDPGSEIVALLGSKEAIGHLPTAVVNPGETVLVPEPGYPVYTAGTIFAGGKCHYMPLLESNRWLPRLDDIPAEVRRAAKLMYLNYPNNPTAACAPRRFFEEAVAFAREYGILIAQDAAYSEVYFDQKVKPASVLEIPGAKDIAIELHSLSKTFNMTGWRIGFAVGNKEALAALAKVKSNCDSGVFGALQEAAITALEGVNRPEIQEQLRSYQRRRDILVPALQQAGWSIHSPQATFYVWARPAISRRGGSVGGVSAATCDSMAVASRILEEANVVVIPGIGFGLSGEGYIRFALTVDEARTQEAAARLTSLSW